MANFNSRKSTKGLKRTSERGVYYDVESGTTFKKDKNGNLKMQIDDYERKTHRATMERLRYYEKKYNISLKREKEIEKRNWKEYVDSVKKWNKGEINRANTVSRRLDNLNSRQRATNRYYSSSNVKLKSDITEKKKVMVMRMSGKHGVYNGKAYDDYIQGLSYRLKVSKEEVEKHLFPNGIEESSKYKDIVDNLNNGMNTIDDLIDRQLENGIISEDDAFFTRELLDTGEEL